MNSSMARLREAGSFIAGLLIGIAIAIPVFAMTVVEPSDGQLLWVVAAPVILVLGLVLQVVVITKPRHRRVTDPAPGASSVGFMKLSHGR